MKYLPLLLTLFIFSCGTEAEPAEPETETVRIGSFDVVTNLDTGEKHADWVGSQSAKMNATTSDTVWFDSPDGQSIVIKESPIESPNEGAQFTFQDSTYTLQEMESFSDYSLTNPLIGEESAWGFGFHNDHISASQTIHYDCEEEYDFSDEESFEFKYTYEESDQKVHIFNTNGMIDAIDIIVCS